MDAAIFGDEDVIKYILTKNEYTVDTVFDGEEGLAYSLLKIYDLIILDIMLPKIDGIKILKTIREKKINTPVLLLTAKTTTEDKVLGLDCGADDYLTKPFETKELLARVRALLRRKGEIIEDIINLHDISLNNNHHILSSNNLDITLSPKEFDIIKILMLNNKNIVTKEFLIEKVWGFDKDTDYNNLEVYISFLRKKLNFLNSKVYIKTIRGVGYCLGI